MNKFKKVNGEIIEDIKEYINNYIVEYPDVELYIGTDSEQNRTYTTYVTVIGLLRPRKGVHIIFKKIKVKKIKDIFSRLWNEVEYSKIIAEDLKDINKNITVHIDINNDNREKSNMVHDSAVGYLKGLGYMVESKPNSWLASKAADKLC